jgi:copper chaperone
MQMTQAELYPTWQEIVTYSANGPHHEMLINTDEYNAVLVGLEAKQKIAPHPSSAATCHFLEGTGWMLVDGERLGVGPGATVIVPTGVLRGVEAETRLAFLGSHGVTDAKKTARTPFKKFGLVALLGLFLMVGLMIVLGLPIFRTSPLTMMYSSGIDLGLGMWGLMILPFVVVVIMFVMMFVFFRFSAGNSGSMASIMSHGGLKSRTMGFSHDQQSQREENNMTTLTYNIPSISCHHCKMSIERKVGKLSGVASASVDVSAKQAAIKFGPPTTETEIKELLAEIDYPAESQ